MRLKILKAELCLINLNLYLVNLTESNTNRSIPRKLYTVFLLLMKANAREWVTSFIPEVIRNELTYFQPMFHFHTP